MKNDTSDFEKLDNCFSSATATASSIYFEERFSMIQFINNTSARNDRDTVTGLNIISLTEGLY